MGNVALCPVKRRLVRARKKTVRGRLTDNESETYTLLATKYVSDTVGILPRPTYDVAGNAQLAPVLSSTLLRVYAHEDRGQSQGRDTTSSTKTEKGRNRRPLRINPPGVPAGIGP